MNQQHYNEYHTPALLNETLEALRVISDGTYVDVTLGGGGHTSGILELLANGRLIAFDQDADAAQNLPDDGRVVFVRHNFKFLRNFLRYLGVSAVDGILGDLGVSSHDFDVAERGFSFRFDAPLDMRMNRQQHLTAADVINGYSEADLSRVLRQYGEVEQADRLARRLVAARKRQPLSTSAQLRECIGNLLPPNREAKYLAKVFQALRIETNGELDALKELLQQGSQALKTGGRFVVITYHSLEDRLVKNFFRAGNFTGIVEKDFFGNISGALRPVNRKVITPAEGEVARNPRARSAKLRIAEKL
ncbi:MAG: 16S rRNA (cytosine(1402)-N(4))-methyltransferase RsmH [Bacteroidales bacterium]|jgi:16S rRNA (cytosine1402-N4)-methyltransferase|nr:16S rRNA (cytosine(1402)-N(4))-methyltransferase RsmH [Bacteroidales bacterium]